VQHDKNGAAGVLAEPVERRKRTPNRLVPVRVDLLRQVRDERVDHKQRRPELANRGLELRHVVRNRDSVLVAGLRRDRQEVDAREISLDGFESRSDRRRGIVLGGCDQRCRRLPKFTAGVASREQAGELAFPKAAQTGKNRHHPTRDAAGIKPVDLGAFDLDGSSRKNAATRVALWACAVLSSDQRSDKIETSFVLLVTQWADPVVGSLAVVSPEGVNSTHAASLKMSSASSTTIAPPSDWTIARCAIDPNTACPRSSSSRTSARTAASSSSRRCNGVSATLGRWRQGSVFLVTVVVVGAL
jgi:hypothetical protein